MTRIQKWMTVVSTLAVGSLIAVPAFCQGGTKQAASAIPVQSVQVVNTPNVNVANTPSVNVTNTPSVDIANTPSVNLASGASVSVTSPLDSQGNPTPLAVLEAFQPYEDQCVMAFSGALSAQCNFQTVPAGKQLVIQEFDAICELDTGERPIYMDLKGGLDHYFVPMFTGNQVGVDVYVTNQETRLYAAAGKSPLCAAQVTDNSHQTCACQFSGYLVDVPDGSTGVVAPAHRNQTRAAFNRGSASPRAPQ